MVPDRNCVNRSDFKTISKLCKIKTEPFAVSCEHKILWLFRSALVPDFPYLKTVTLTAFCVFALFEKFEV